MSGAEPEKKFAEGDIENYISKTWLMLAALCNHTMLCNFVPL